MPRRHPHSSHGSVIDSNTQAPSSKRLNKQSSTVSTHQQQTPTRGKTKNSFPLGQGALTMSLLSNTVASKWTFQDCRMEPDRCLSACLPSFTQSWNTWSERMNDERKPAKVRRPQNILKSRRIRKLIYLSKNWESKRVHGEYQRTHKRRPNSPREFL